MEQQAIYKRAQVYLSQKEISDVCSSIEPGFGARSEIDVFMLVDGPCARPPVQHEVVLIEGLMA